ncbi:GGDEF domain-containing protein [Shewanella waksmanii]|uniref:GGDEF domain-containing protein n=1 Tax=Shewanella waksmanii TaxID=213783 RepID=UPI00048A9D33|nr:GGDEF domain-containing protein [Shewanella waksmanii]
MYTPLPSADQLLERERLSYSVMGVKWATLLSFFLIAAIYLTIYSHPEPVISLIEAMLFTAPVFAIGLAGHIFFSNVVSHKHLRSFLVCYLVLLNFAWLIIISRLAEAATVDASGAAAIAGIESVVDILILTFAIALFPNRIIMLMMVLPLMAFNVMIRLDEIPNNFIFPATKFFCFAVILYTGQQVFSSWFVQSILRNLENKKLLQQFKRLALVDGLTNLSNRRHFDDILLQEIKVTERNNRPLSLIMLDVDYFKRLNDKAGHQAGDECLSQLGQLLAQSAMRPRDLAARYGGEEFVIVLPETDIAGAGAIAANIKADIAALKLPHPDSENGEFVTVSQGVCQWRNGMSATDFTANADKMLYQAKQAGRDQFVVDEQ